MYWKILFVHWILIKIGLDFLYKPTYLLLLMSIVVYIKEANFCIYIVYVFVILLCYVINTVQYRLFMYIVQYCVCTLYNIGMYIVQYSVFTSYIQQGRIKLFFPGEGPESARVVRRIFFWDPPGLPRPPPRPPLNFHDTGVDSYVIPF